MHKREFGLVCLAFLACFGMGVFIGLAGKIARFPSLISVCRDDRHFIRNEKLCVCAALLYCCSRLRAGPPITSTTQQSVSRTSSHPNGSDMATGPYHLITPLLTSYHQQFWLIAQVVTENKDG